MRRLASLGLASLVAVVVLALAGAASAAGTVTATEERVSSPHKITLAWTSDGSGNVSGTSTSFAYSGEIIRLVTVPDGVAAPTDDYDVTLLDEDGVDVLMGAGIDRDTANTEQVLASSLGCVANDKLQLVISGAGATKQGTVHVYVR